jgi:hypothetical protein
MNIIIFASPSVTADASFKVSLDDLGYTKKEWNKLKESERASILQTWLDQSSEPPYWALNDYNGIEEN